MDIQRIPTEGARIPPLRNISRVVLEVTTDLPGTQIEGHPIRVQLAEGGARLLTTARVEVYVDRLPSVLAMLRLPEHDRVYAMAVEMNDRLVSQWIEGEKVAMRGMTAEERKRYIDEHCNLVPNQQLGLLGYRAGLPPLRSVKLVNQHDELVTVDAADYAALSADEQSEYLIAPPQTSENAMERATRILAEVLARATEKRK